MITCVYGYVFAILSWLIICVLRAGTGPQWEVQIPEQCVELVGQE